MRVNGGGMVAVVRWWCEYGTDLRFHMSCCICSNLPSVVVQHHCSIVIDYGGIGVKAAGTVVPIRYLFPLSTYTYGLNAQRVQPTQLTSVLLVIGTNQIQVRFQCYPRVHPCPQELLR